MKPSPKVAQAIIEKKVRYCRFADSGRFDLFDQIAVPDFKFAPVDNGVGPATDSIPKFTSRDEWAAPMGKMMAISPPGWSSRARAGLA